MKKKIAFVLSILMMVVMLGACGTDPTTVDYNGVSYEELQATSTGLLDALSTMNEEIAAYYMQSGDELTNSIIQAWMDNTSEVGDFINYDNFTVTKSGKTLTTDMVVHFTGRDVVFEIVYNYYDMSVPTGVTVEPVYSLGEKMKKAGLNTLISMLIVFCVLILISLIISAFKIFPYLENRKKEKEAQLAANEKDASAELAPVEEEVVMTDDTELVAVIAAAIAASTGTSTSDFVVRSINRR